MSAKLFKIIFLLSANVVLFIPPTNAVQLDAVVNANVAFSKETEIYKYQYSVSSDINNTYNIQIIDIDIEKPTGSKNLPNQGLMIIERNGTQTEYENYWTLKSKGFPGLMQSIIPVGFHPPDNWVAVPTMSLSVSWAATTPFGESRHLIRPGETKDGFELTSYGLPGIRIVRLYVSVPFAKLLEEAFNKAYQTTPPEEMTEEQVVAINKVVRDETSIRITTIGPTSPQKNFVALDFINYLISLRRQAETHLWITQPSIIPALDAKLDLVKASLTANNNAAAITDLNDLINEVENKKKVALTSEAYILLKFNVLYLREKLLRSK
ncbi:hypothetical protein [Candidatus Manganitrophus noduliformans]|uniref:Uncharacterized protein n=1 Tax=Candidatus Manganitrophus noduliformans TaxID=2606439 RepID=A0A7X6IC57_9BACT|nr:hypothetical protein [Candidatus Manganitrophus noduliformans]NKE72231.1 hypothetical protein [Candidatus Manganitrophus noduliformans]